MRALIVEDGPDMAEAIRDGLRLEALAADIAGGGDTALELLSSNGEPWIIATMAGVGYRIDTAPSTGRAGNDRG